MRSGSTVRPQKMYEAFLKAGHNVKLLKTEQNRRGERKAAVRELIDWLDENDVDACYVESPSGPIFNRIDVDLLKKVKSKEIPMSIFYRDAYWLFLDDYMKNHPLKRRAVIYMQKKDIKAFRETMDAFYMPSDMCCRVFAETYPMKNMKALPPGTEVCGQPFKTTYTGIYVGGLSKLYGADTLLEAYKLLNDKGKDYRLIMICRENEFAEFFAEPEIPEWLEVYHVSGKEALEPLYERCDCAFLPHRKMLQTDLAFGIKLFEYLSYGKPVISNDLTEMGGFIKKYNCGMIFDQTAEALAETIDEYYTATDRDELNRNALNACEQNTWDIRAGAVIGDLQAVQEARR